MNAVLALTATQVGAVSAKLDLAAFSAAMPTSAEALTAKIGPLAWVMMGIAYLLTAFVLAVAIVRFAPNGWLRKKFRKYLWLIPFSPLVIAFVAAGLLLKQVAAILSIAAMSFRRLFEKATGQQTYQRQRQYSRYSYNETQRRNDRSSGK